MLNPSEIRQKLLAFNIGEGMDDQDYVVTGYSALALQQLGGIVEADDITIAVAPDVYQRLASEGDSETSLVLEEYEITVYNDSAAYYYNAGNDVRGVQCQRPYNVWSAYKNKKEHAEVVTRLAAQLRIG
jgi:hypothetical protein